jgi:hypothetical protein
MKRRDFITLLGFAVAQRTEATKPSSARRANEYGLVWQSLADVRFSADQGQALSNYAPARCDVARGLALPPPPARSLVRPWRY